MKRANRTSASASPSTRTRTRPHPPTPIPARSQSGQYNAADPDMDPANLFLGSGSDTDYDTIMVSDSDTITDSDSSDIGTEVGTEFGTEHGSEDGSDVGSIGSDTTGGNMLNLEMNVDIPVSAPPPTPTPQPRPMPPNVERPERQPAHPQPTKVQSDSEELDSRSISFVYKMRANASPNIQYDDLFATYRTRDRDLDQNRDRDRFTADRETTPIPAVMPSMPIICVRIATHAKYPFIQIVLCNQPGPGSGSGSLALPVFYPKKSNDLSVDDQARQCIQTLVRNSPMFRAPTASTSSETNPTEAISDTLDGIHVLGVIADRMDTIYMMVDISDVPLASHMRLHGLEWRASDSICLALPTEIINVGSTWGRAIDPATTAAMTSLPEIAVIHLDSGIRASGGGGRGGNGLNARDISINVRAPLPRPHDCIFPVPDAGYFIGAAHMMRRVWHLGMPRQKVYKMCGSYIFLYNAWPTAQQLQLYCKQFRDGGQPTSVPFEKGQSGYMHDVYIGKCAVFYDDPCQSFIEYTDELTLTDVDINSKMYSKSSCISICFINTDKYEYVCEDSLRPGLLVQSASIHTALGCTRVV